MASVRHVRIAVSTDKVKLGEKYRVEKLYFNSGRVAVKVWNPMSDDLSNQFGGEVLVSDEKDNFLVDLLSTLGGSAVISSPFTLPANAIAGREFELVAGKTHFPLKRCVSWGSRLAQTVSRSLEFPRGALPRLNRLVLRPRTSAAEEDFCLTALALLRHNTCNIPKALPIP